MRKKNVQNMRELMQEFLQTNQQLEKGVLESRVIQNWAVIMGPSVDRCTKRIFLSKSGILYVELNSSVVRNELLMLREKIISSLNQSVGASLVNDIVLK